MVGSSVHELLEADVYAGARTVLGRGRRRSDVVGEVMGLLAGETRIVVCDLGGLAEGTAVTRMFAPVSEYLAAWPGAALVARVPDPLMRDRLRLDEHPQRLLVTESWVDGVVEAEGALPPVQHRLLRLGPSQAGVREARAFAARTLHDWQLTPLVDSTMLVVSELVTNSILHAATMLRLMLSSADGCVRVAVSDHDDVAPISCTGEHPAWDSLTGRGLMLVEAMSRSWGVLPSSSPGKTVWSVLDGSSAKN